MSAPSVLAQTPRGTAIARGHVTNLLKQPLPEVVVEAGDSAGHLAASAHTDADGAYVIRGLRSGATYIFSARRIGYAREITAPKMIPSSDTLSLDFGLTNAATQLPTVEVTALPRPEYRVTDQEIASRHDDVSDIGPFLERWKPRMLGDSWKMCSTLVPPRMRTGQGRGNISRGNTDALPLKVYVNGVRAAPWDLLEIRAKDVLEARYFDCNDRDPMLRNSLIIALKPNVAW
ncbi:MAG: carboxypeptidase-like regulatory domain-containing protein [Gemmatimonadota bacterium]|nr:carboxypeptidase-like regulatory domain-containing protein [Gemmatimonadota bacterium]